MTGQTRDEEGQHGQDDTHSDNCGDDHESTPSIGRKNTSAPSHAPPTYAIACILSTFREGGNLRNCLRLAATHATHTSADVVRSMHELGSASALYEDQPPQRRFRDANAVPCGAVRLECDRQPTSTAARTQARSRSACASALRQDQRGIQRLFGEGEPAAAGGKRTEVRRMVEDATRRTSACRQLMPRWNCWLVPVPQVH
ncbi:hypothetical protein [Streptomyces sp. SP18BB07]|uniref:hypothetical protein n=1 Tax=Streptomyces sp. SP18BB07 TaxID=3002522 RepID=UPI002E7A44D3|nr:hypothetical protein [Streptomyces sp. SP18BB07]MEE1761341.1 hypothetical protein [Streptomyces sp. SP18BB07]